MTKIILLFLASFYSFLNYDSVNDFVIDLNNIWKWLGFGRKSDCKAVLVKHFKENKDFIIEKAAAASSVAAPETDRAASDDSIKINKNLGGAGKNKENILMTIRTFKKLCLKAKTTKSDEIRDYKT